MNKTFINWLEERYISLNEDGGVPITKDNVEEGFERYLEELDVQEVIELADMYVADVKEELLNELRKN